MLAAPTMFPIYINDMDKDIHSYMSFFADDAKLLRKVSAEDDCMTLQQDLDKLWEWSRKWEMDFNINKCSVMEFGKSKHRISGQYKLGDGEVDKLNLKKI